MLNFKRKKFIKNREIDPEDIFIDSANLPGLDKDRLEGRLEQPIGEKTFLFFKIALVLIVIFLAGRLYNLDVSHGEQFAQVSEQNSLSRSVIFANRGVITDRNGVPLAQNDVKATTTDYAGRIYADIAGLAPVVGYVKYPSQDSQGHFYDENYHGMSGVEKTYDSTLSGTNGSKLTETDAKGHISSESVIDSPKDGQDLKLSIDAKVTQELYNAIASTAKDRGFTGGSAVIEDVRTGEILALTSYPTYDQNIVTSGTDKSAISTLLTDKGNPFLNRAVSGLYTPGSVVKPIVALGALTENVIDPKKQILSTGQISLPNPYYPNNPTIFKDWRAQGWVNMIDALAVSSDVYFYEVGGGYGTQPGLGVSNLDKYFSLFGMNEKTNIDLPSESQGTIASPAWKEKNFPDDPIWRIGDTYHTAIGQYGTQVTPIEAVRWVSAVANGGKVLVPTVVSLADGQSPKVERTINLDPQSFATVREGMRQSALRGTGAGLNIPEVEVATKTGTAELGASKANVNSWVTGFFPYEDPHYAFVVTMEHGPVTNTIGGVFVMRTLLDWMKVNAPEYLK